MTPLHADTLLNALYELFARPEPTLGLALGRIVLGLVLMVDGLRMLADHSRWHAQRAALRPTSAPLPAALDLFGLVHRLGLPSIVVPGLLVASALAFALGAGTTVAGIVLLLTLTALAARNPMVVYGGDAVARTFVLLLMLSPCDRSLGVDRWLADGSWGLDAQAAPWGGRLVQLEIVALYLTNYLHKAAQAPWRQGRVLRSLLRNRNFARHPLPPLVARPSVARVLTWAALLTEFALPVALVFEPTAALACLAAAVFHLSIARCIDVHMFSYVMLAGLCACIPRGALTAVIPSDLPRLDAAPPDVAAGIALLLALAYVAYAILWELPPTGWISSRVRRTLSPVLQRVFWARGWQLFTGECREQYEIEFVTVDRQGGVQRWMWTHPEAWSVAQAAHDPRRPNHRFQRFKFSVVRHPQARELLLARLRHELAQQGRTVRASSVDVVVIDVHGERGADAGIVDGFNLRTEIATNAGAGFDHEACALLLASVRSPPTRATLAELSLFAGLRAALDDLPRDGLAAALERMSHPSGPASIPMPPLSGATRSTLTALCASLPPSLERTQLSAVLGRLPPHQG